MFKRKIAAATAAVSLMALISGTYAWTSLNSQKINEWSGAGSQGPGGTLHDDHDDRVGNDENKDVYVENWGNEDLFVRIKLTEYMEAGQGAGLKSVATDPGTGEIIHNLENLAKSIKSIGDIDHPDTWYSIWDRFPYPGDGLPPTGVPSWHLADTYWEWGMGGQKYYYPAPVGDRENKKYVDQNSPDNLTKDSENENKVRAKRTRKAAIMTMRDWKNAGKPVGDYWVVDMASLTDVWIYWAAPLKPKEATGLLLDRVTKKDWAGQNAGQYEFDKGYYYGINVEAQFATKTGETDANGQIDNYMKFGDEANGGWSKDGEALMERIAADVIEEIPVYKVTLEAGEGGAIIGDKVFGEYMAGAKILFRGELYYSASDGYVFDKWLFSDGGKLIYNAPFYYFLMPKGDLTLTATFKKAGWVENQRC